MMLSMMALNLESCYAECHLSLVSFVPSVANNPSMLSVIMLNVVMLSVLAPQDTAQQICLQFWTPH